MNRETVPEIAFGAVNALVASALDKLPVSCLWLSGLELSASLGIPDRNLLTVENYEVACRALRSASSKPIIVDIDNAQGSVYAAHVLGRRLFDAGATTVCLEDSAYPKCNSFDLLTKQGLAPMDLMMRQIEALKDSEPRLEVIARTEALIAGRDLEVATDRVLEYATSGADRLLVHSKDATGREAYEIGARLAGRSTVIIPTAFPEVPVSVLASWGFSLVIYANQLTRVLLRAVYDTARTVLDCGALHGGIEMVAMSELIEVGEASQTKRQATASAREVASRKVQEVERRCSANEQ